MISIVIVTCPAVHACRDISIDWADKESLVRRTDKVCRDSLHLLITVPRSTALNNVRPYRILVILA